MEIYEKTNLDNLVGNQVPEFKGEKKVPEFVKFEKFAKVPRC